MNLTKPNSLSIVRRYSGWRTRLFLLLNALSNPYEEVASLIPTSAHVLDFGCGHGFLSILIGKRLPDTTVVGLDIDPRKLVHARRAAEGLRNVSFVTTLEEVSLDLDVVIAMSVLYLMPQKRQEETLKRLASRLRQGGRLLLIENNRREGLAFQLAYLQEWLMTRVYTMGTGLHYRTVAEWQGLLQSLGPAVVVSRLRSLYQPAYLIACTKQ